ncbi:hypothetical protein P8A18_15020 [Streptomyces castrisilvae]|uniref:Uncharacterized protein n=1 Tax=Streptomyces castrisilvae TaxID=3033811 RepID=A0ABY9HJE6_9ACTN|nr:hypothetical protein [Streptomyces sp. Mut1]WLQ34665.1 hypothetical protein P8A18_15020 [Streptomyces sp. Mut1]
MSTSPLGDYREAAATLSPSAVSQFLAAHQWELEARQDHVREIWRLPGTNGAIEGRIMLPLARGFDDFSQRFTDTLLSLGHIHSLDAVTLYERIIATRADLFFIRLDQAMVDGTIPFQQAEKALQALYKMMRSAATTAHDPSRSHSVRSPSVVSNFLEDDVRLGHTKRGSFVFTIVARLGDAPPKSEGQGPQAPPFPRRVMETLARGLETTERLTREWSDDVLTSPGRAGISAGLVESLEDLSQPSHLRQLDLSFEWAAAEPRPDVGLATITLDRDVMVELPRVRERLVRQEEPPRQETLVGLVKGLNRDDSASADDEETADVTLAAEVNGKSRLVHVMLSGEDHEWAIQAYQEKLPFTVSGSLSYERRAWRLVSDIEVDASFLRHHAAQPALPDVRTGIRGELEG